MTDPTSFRANGVFAPQLTQPERNPIMPITTAVRTDRGKVRPWNADVFGLFPELQTYVVADGMGGQQGGTLASTLAVETIRRALLDTDVQARAPSLERLQPNQRLLNAVYRAHTHVLELSRRQLELWGMGTTVAAVAFDPPHETAVICHVGDTRVYRLREEVLEPLTEDHTIGQQLVRAGLMSPQEWRTSRYRHVLTQAVGVGPEVQPTVRLETLQAGDLFLICSDGVYGDLVDEEIHDLVRKGGTNLQQVCDALVELAHARGGRDDRTVVALRYSLA
jgi:serine/threonine protein phosphatase PrpC